MAPRRAAAEAAQRITSLAQSSDTLTATKWNEVNGKSKSRKLSIGSDSESSALSELVQDVSSSDFEQVEMVSRTRATRRTKSITAGKAKATNGKAKRTETVKTTTKTVTSSASASSSSSRSPAASAKSKAAAKPRTKPKAAGKRTRQQRDSSGSDSEYVVEEETESEDDVALVDEDEEEAPSSKTLRPKRSPQRHRSAANRSQQSSPATAASSSVVSTAQGESGSSESAETLLQPRFITEFTKASRASCRRCSNVIVRETLRVGLVVDHKDYGPSTHWYHAKCRPLSVPLTVLTQPALLPEEAATKGATFSLCIAFP